MTGEIMLAEVRLGLHDTAARDTILRMTFENAAEQLARDDLGGTRVEVWR